MASKKLKIDQTKKLILTSGRASVYLAKEVAENLGVELLPTKAYNFANGEIYVRFNESVRGASVFVFQTHCDPINDNIMEQLIMIDALKRASARNITVVIPCLGYSRQDKKSLGREPITSRLIFDMFTAAGASRIVSIDMHAAQAQGFFDGPVDHLTAQDVLSEKVNQLVKSDKVTIVSPDAGRIRVSEEWVTKFPNAKLAFVHKTRDVTQPNVSKVGKIVGDVEGRDCIVVDDLIDTAGTIAKSVEAVKKAGAKNIYVVGTHAVFSPPAVEKLSECAAEKVIVTNSLPITDEKKFSKLEVVSIAPLLARALKAIFAEKSVASLFGPES
ncbi:MAG: ribose-phosphate diphosphokinase [Bifidobacteriaceae bacterium]|jgi:ribose-phosphate pyrophosphokinase|nr:ribose-phosphate diphosphokinase [Bifidobacteriaceae bacterium]